MSKRQTDREDSPYSKRIKLSKSEKDVSTRTTPVEIHSSKDLQRLIAFDQGAGPQSRQKIQDFKSFLDTAAYSDDAELKARKRSLLQDYLDQARPQASGGLVDVIRSWSFAAQSNDERLFSAIAAVLALFLKTTSTSIEFRKHGNQLCQALLEEDNVRLIERGLTANKAKERVISPCLRLLTEIVTYDGGAAAKQVWHRRDFTFLRLEILLTIRKEKAADLKEPSRKPSVRDNALRYLFANLRLQSPSAKAGILTLSHGKLARAIFQDLEQDSAALLTELLSTFNKYVVADIDLPRHIKKWLFREDTLARLTALYRHQEDPGMVEPKPSVRQNAHSLLMTLCTWPDSGLWESSRVTRTDIISPGHYEAHESGQSNGAEHSDMSSWGRLKYGKALLMFLQGLRPYANSLEEELVLAVFRTAPGMLADYFQRKKSFSYEPKLTATWIGFSKFLISVIMLPIPAEYLQLFQTKSVEHSLSTDNILDSVLPPPLSQKILTRCLNQNVDLVAFLAIRIMTVAFKKFETLIEALSTHPSTRRLAPETPQTQTVAQLVDGLRTRCPEVRHVITGFRSTPEEKPILREAFSRLLLYYYRLIPRNALEEKFDVSITLSKAFISYDTLSDKRFQVLELGQLLEVAKRTPDIHWWHKADKAALSPFTTLLRLYSSKQSLGADNSIRQLLQRIAEENHVLSYNDASSIDVLVHSLQSSPASTEIYEFIDNITQHLLKKSVKYFERMCSLRVEHGLKSNGFRNASVDLLMIGIADQWSFLVKASKPAALADVVGWVVSYLKLSKLAGRDPQLLSILRDEIMQSIVDKSTRSTLAQALDEPSSTHIEHVPQLNGIHKHEGGRLAHAPSSTGKVGSIEGELFSDLEPPKENGNHKELTRWLLESVPEIVFDDTLGELTLCLCSQHEDIRRQALSAVRKVEKSLKESDWTEALQIYVLLGEVIETVENLEPGAALPYFAGVFASRCYLILTEPLHPLYTKVNSFLQKGPQWKINKLPSYWIDKILLQPPTEDDGYHAETRWLLDFLLDGLRTPNDMEVYRRCNVIERLLTLATSEPLSGYFVEKVVQLCYRCTYVGGSTTLITRCGFLDWIKILAKSSAESPKERLLLHSLASQVHKTCDKSRVDEWTGRGGSSIESMFASLE